MDHAAKAGGHHLGPPRLPAKAEATMRTLVALACVTAAKAEGTRLAGMSFIG